MCNICMQHDDWFDVEDDSPDVLNMERNHLHFALLRLSKARRLVQDAYISLFCEIDGSYEIDSGEITRIGNLEDRLENAIGRLNNEIIKRERSLMKLGVTPKVLPAY